MPEGDETEAGGSGSWWSRHGTTIFILALAASISFIIRTIYAYQLISTCDITYCFAGGSDSFYHARVMTWIIQNHTNLIHDPELNYPLGSTNPREPLFDWMNAILGIILAPLFGGNPVTAGNWVLEMQPPFWAAVGVIPVYLLGKEFSSRRMGLVAALLYPLVVGNIESTVATYANYLPFYTFFVLLSCYTYLHTIKLSGTRRWVESYRSPRAVWAGLKEFVRVEEYAVRWSVLTGVTLGATMFAWQGYTYVVAVVVIFLAALVFVERVRRHDTFGAYMLTLLSGTIGFLLAMPYYYVQGEFGYWFTVPILLYFGGLLVLLPFLMMRDVPWVLSVPLLVGSVAAGAAALFVYSPAYFNAVLTGQGYFVKNLIFSTVAEAQAPSFDALIVSYGIATFLLTFIGLAVFVAYLYVYRFRREHLFMVIFGLMSIYLPISAAKFFLLGSPIFVLLPAECLVIGLDRIGAYPQLRRNLASLSERGGGRLAALRRSFKLRHLILGVVVILVVLPNVSWAVDSGIPYNVQSQYSQQIYNTLPSFLQTNPANASSFYLGIAGIETDTPQQYDEAGYNWLATQDTFEAPADRPALVSWWDYGFQTIDEGQHPVVADNFQEGIDPSGNFLLAQNESNAIAVLAADLLVAEAEKSGNPYLPSSLDAILARDGVNTTELHNFMINTTADIGTVLSNPSFTTGYGTHNPANLDQDNAEYDTISHLLASTLSENGVVQVYQDIQDYTGWSIRYAMADTRLFPTSASNTGIYYAPVDLTDGVIGGGGLPSSYFTATETDSNGNVYQLGSVPAGVSIVSSNINYNAPFYNSMIYKIEVGYNGTDVGAGTGIPGLTLSSDNPEPGWMMQHFFMVYRTAYWCPYTDYQSHPNCFEAVNTNVADSRQAAGYGTADTSASSYFNSGGETILAYYAGATVQGQVELPGGTPVPGVRVTLNDQWGTPHMTAVTGSDGQFSLIAPPGNDTLVTSLGTVNPLTQAGSTTLSTFNLTVRPDQGYGDDPTPILDNLMLRPGSISGSVYWNRANSTSYSSTDLLIPGATVSMSNGLGTTRSSVVDPSGVYSFPNTAPGSYNLTLAVGSTVASEGTVTVTNAAAISNNLGITLTDVHGMILNLSGKAVAGANVTLANSQGYHASDITLTGGNYSFSPVPPGNYTLSAYYPGGQSSRPIHVDISSFKSNITNNITLETPVSISLLPLYNGNHVPNLPVRFSPLAGAGNTSYTYFAGSNGWIDASIPAGNWSVYAFGAINGTYVSGLGDLHLSASASSFSGTGGVLELTPAAVLSGQATVPGVSGAQSGVSLILQDAAGAVLTASTNASGRYSLFLPLGQYAVEANYTTSSGSDAALGGVDLQADTTLDLSLATAVAYHTRLGYVTPNGAFNTLADERVNLTDVTTSSTFQLLSGTGGAISMNLPVGSEQFDLTSKVFGFAPFQAGPVTETQLNSHYTELALNISQVPVHVLVLNPTSHPAGTPQINFTAISGGASTENTTGTNLTVDLYPGIYSVGVNAGYSTGNLRPFQNLTLTVPVGSLGVFLNITIYPAADYHINATTGKLPLSRMYALLTGSEGTLALNGSTLRSGFIAPAGRYNLWVTTSNATGEYAFFDPVTLYHNASRAPVAVPGNITLLKAGSLALTLTSPTGHVINASLTLGVSNGNGTYTSITTGPNGNATLVLPRGGYNFTLDTTVLLYVGGLTQYWNVSTNSSANTCAVNPNGASTCTLVLKVVRALDTLHSALSLSNVLVAGGSGTIYVSPVNSSAASRPQSFPISEGSAVLSLLPGSYVVYTVLDSNGVPYVNFTRLSVGYESGNIAFPITLLPAYTQWIKIAPSRGLPDPGLVALNFSTPLHTNVTIENVTVGSEYPLLLPSGSYVVGAEARVAWFTSEVQLFAEANLTVASSNSYATLLLLPQYTPSVTITEVGSGSVSVQDGQSVAFSFVVNNTGPLPISVRVSGSPSTWKMVLTPANLTLGVASYNRSAVFEAVVTVPAGTATTTNPLVFSVYPSIGGAELTSVSVPLSIVPVYGMSAGSETSNNKVSAGSIVLGFQVLETGNTQESATLSVANSVELTQDGWTYSLQSTSGTGISGPESLTPDSSAFSGQVVLFPKTSAPTFPSYVEVLAQDEAHPQSFATAYLPVTSHAMIGVNTSYGVTGPSVGGSPPASYLPTLYTVLTIVPALAIVTVAAVWRWWRTRRWTHR